MTFKEAQNEFAVRYYLWAREEFRLEVENGFPLLRRLGASSSRKCLRLMDELSRGDQIALSVAFVKRFHEQAMMLVGDSLSDEENDMIRSYTDRGLLHTLPEDEDYWNRRASRDPCVRLNRKRFKKMLQDSLSPILGLNDGWGGGGTWRYDNPIGNLRMHTYLDVGSKSYQMSYSHNIVFSEYELLLDHGSVLSWLGLASQTSWNRLDDSEAESATCLLAELCARFLEVAPKLIKGIEP